MVFANLEGLWRLVSSVVEGGLEKPKQGYPRETPVAFLGGGRERLQGSWVGGSCL